MVSEPFYTEKAQTELVWINFAWRVVERYAFQSLNNPPVTDPLSAPPLYLHKLIKYYKSNTFCD